MSRAATRPPRRGAALPLVLVALVVGAVAAAAILGAGAAAAREAHLPIAAARADATAEGAVAHALVHWDPAWTRDLLPGGVVTRPVTTAAGAATLLVARLDASRFLLVGSAPLPPGTWGGAGARRAALVARLRHLRAHAPAAVTGAGPLRLHPGALVAGGDATPDGWTACAPTAAPPEPVPALRLPDPAALDAAPGTVVGPIVPEPVAGAPDPYDRFGDERWATLTARATVRHSAGGAHSPVPAVDASGACAAGAWGEPWRGAGAVAPCAARASVVHLAGPGVTTLRGPARFQGVLLVDGDLAIDGTVHGVGLVVVRGALLGPGALLLDGALLVQGGPSALHAGARVRASTCALDAVRALAERPAPLARRPWLPP